MTKASLTKNNNSGIKFTKIYSLGFIPTTERLFKTAYQCKNTMLTGTSQSFRNNKLTLIQILVI